MSYRIVFVDRTTVAPQIRVRPPLFTHELIETPRRVPTRWSSASRLLCDEWGHDKLLAFNCKRRGFCPSSGARHTMQTAVRLADIVIPHVPVH